jgi:N-acetylneuraminic acid mutarotase
LGNSGIPAPNIEGSRISYKDGGLYMLDSIYNGSQSSKVYRYDLKSNSWSILDKTGSGLDYIQAHGQCAYEESLYIIQGYNSYSGGLITQMYKVDIESNNKVSEPIEIFEFSNFNAAFGCICSGDTVYIFGGFTGSEGLTNKLFKMQLSSYELNFTELSKSMNTPIARYGHAMEVYDEKLYILGGKDIQGNDLINVMAFDLKTETWNTLNVKSSLPPSPRSEFAHTRIGEILIMFGGASGNILLGDIHYFNLRTQEIKAVEVKSTNQPTNRKGSCMAAAGDAIFIFGGITKQGYSDELWMFNSGENTYTLLKPSGDTPSRTARGGCKAYIERNGDIMFETYLGETVSRLGLSGIYRYNLSTNAWTSIKPENEDKFRASQSAALYLEGKLLVAGGAFTDYFCKNDIFIYDIKTKTTKKLDQVLPYMAYNGASVFYKNKLYIHGGGASFQRLALPDIPTNNLIVIDLEDEWNDTLEISNTICSPGTHYDNESCIPCPMGTYQDDNGNKECKKCSAGFYSDTEGADSIRFCKPCSQGTFNTQVGETMCYDCPSGYECSKTKAEYSLYTYENNFTSDQPDIYETKEEISILYSNYFNIVLCIVSFMVIIHLLSYVKTRRLIQSIDLYQLRHNYEINKAVIKRKTLFGGLFTLIFISAALSILFRNTLSLIIDNITETKSLVPIVALQEKYENVIYI